MFHNTERKIVVQDQADGDHVIVNDESEHKDDLLAIITVFVRGTNGKRSAATRRARRLSAQKEAEKEEGAEGGIGRREEEEGQCGAVTQLEDLSQ